MVSPVILSYLITSKCNSHCITCNVWKNKENVDIIDVFQLKKILNSKLFSNIGHVGISGGEPSTFEDLFNHIEVLVETLPNLQTISITSNCINYKYWEDNLTKISNYLKSKNIYFQINISLDGIGDMHDKVRGTKGNFNTFLKVLKYIKQNEIPYQIHTTVNRQNVYQLPGILHFAKRNESQIIFRLASTISRLNNNSLQSDFAVDESQLSFFCDFISSSEVRKISSLSRRLYYRSLCKQLLSNSKERVANCYFKQQGVVLSSDGKISHCSRFENRFDVLSKDESEIKRCYFDKDENEANFSEICKFCYHDQSGYWSPQEIISDYVPQAVKNLFKVSAIIKYLSAHFKKSYNTNSTKGKVCIIGMYGGEHVGDAAILGGVIDRLQKRHLMISEVKVYSFRKDRTDTWIKSIKKFPDLKISSTDDIKTFLKDISESDLLVWGGGPIMNIPVILSRNYMFIKKALSCNVPFEIEGVGYGPLSSSYCKWLAKKIFKSATYISCRSMADYEKISKIINNLNILCDRDPAFQYLDLLGSDDIPSLNRKIKIDRIVEVCGKDNLIALNLRPLWSRYGKDFSPCDFLDNISYDIDKLLEEQYQIIFYPMNSDQFGFSDLNISYEIKDKLKNKERFHILETEPTIDEVVYLLRQVDYAVSMRFHGAIFALSQKIKTIGLDYDLSKNKKGKIANLFIENDGTYINIAEYQRGDLIKAIKNEV